MTRVSVFRSRNGFVCFSLRAMMVFVMAASTLGAATDVMAQISCVAQIPNNSQTFDCNYYDAGYFDIILPDPLCSWQATTTDSWIYVDSSMREGSGMGHFSLPPNDTGVQRVGTIKV